MQGQIMCDEMKLKNNLFWNTMIHELKGFSSDEPSKSMNLTCMLKSLIKEDSELKEQIEIKDKFTRNQTKELTETENELLLSNESITSIKTSCNFSNQNNSKELKLKK